ncbi:hypothetical protein HYV11_02120 [Candidatus Dependentiae bacterium]|nr:hypothetical protein [Candidatus Dependentiae bacterium]
MIKVKKISKLALLIFIQPAFMQSWGEPDPNFDSLVQNYKNGIHEKDRETKAKQINWFWKDNSTKLHIKAAREAQRQIDQEKFEKNENNSRNIELNDKSFLKRFSDKRKLALNAERKINQLFNSIKGKNMKELNDTLTSKEVELLLANLKEDHVTSQKNEIIAIALKKTMSPFTPFDYNGKKYTTAEELIKKMNDPNDEIKQFLIKNARNENVITMYQTAFNLDDNFIDTYKPQQFRIVI